MTLIKSISGIRGTIGGNPGEGLTPVDIVNFTSAYARLIAEKLNRRDLKVVIGRDARVSGKMVSRLVTGTLQACGVQVMDLGLSTTPTVEMAVTALQADGGIILTASHNPGEWNALKLLNEKGEFISAAEGQLLLEYALENKAGYVTVDKLGGYLKVEDQLEKHIRAILSLDLVDVAAIRAKKFRIAVDAVNSTGGIAVPYLLQQLGVEEVIGINVEPDGLFAHNPEPIPEHLTEISRSVKETGASLGFVVDPDVDRLAMIMEDGAMFGEEYTLVAVADYILQHRPGNTVSNLSSTRALKDVTEKYGGEYYASAVGEVNVVEKMKACNAVIGGEGNGGVIYPELHYGRDALVGIALFLTALAKSGKTCSEFRASFPDYYISKNKIQLSQGIDPDHILKVLTAKYSDQILNTEDGLRIDMGREWVHMRKSNTEPIIRIYAESADKAGADELAGRFVEEISRITC